MENKETYETLELNVCHFENVTSSQKARRLYPIPATTDIRH